MKIVNLKNIFGLILLGLIMAISFRGWFHSGIITHGDWTYHPIEAMRNWFSFPYAWESQVNPASVTPFHLSNYPIRFLFGLLASLGLDFGISERILYHFPILFLSMFSMYYLAHVIFKNRIVSFYSSLLFGLNSYILLLGDHLTIRMAYSLTPLVFAFFIKSVDSRRSKDVIIASILFAVSMAYEIRISYIVLGMVLFYSIYRLVLDLRKGCRNSFQSIKVFSSLLIMTFLLGAYWIIPNLFSGMTGVSNTLPSQPWISWMKLTNAITLSHPFYSLTEVIRSFVVQQIHPIFYLIPILVFLALLLKKDKNVFFFTLLSLVGIFLVKQETVPFGWVYTWMFKNFPGFNLFREASKFYLLIALGYSILIGVTVAEISKKMKTINGISGKCISITFLFLIFSAQLIMAWPIVSGNQKNESYYPIDEIPSEYRAIEDFIKNQPPNESRTLWLPYKSRFSFYSEDYPIITPEASEFLKSLLIPHSQVIEFRTENLGAILNLVNLNVKYVVLAPDLPFWEEKLGEYIYHGSGVRGISIEKYKLFLDGQEDLQRIELGLNIHVYENKKYLPSFIEIKPSNFSLEDPYSYKVENLILNATFEDKNLEGWSINAVNIQNMSLSKDAYDGAYSIETEIYNSTYGWKTIKFPLIPVKYRDSSRWEFYVKGENSYGVHTKMVEYNENRTMSTAYYMGAIGHGDFSWKRVSLNFASLSTETAYIEIQLWYGHETTEPLPNRLWIDSVKVYVHQLLDLDVIWLGSTQIENENFFKLINYRKINPTKYVVKVNTSKPFLLSFGEIYNPLWIANTNGKRIESTLCYPMINGFWINQTGQLEITIAYEPQKWFYYGLIVSATTFLACITYLTYNWTKNKAIWKRIKATFQKPIEQIKRSEKNSLRILSSE